MRHTITPLLALIVLAAASVHAQQLPPVEVVIAECSRVTSDGIRLQGRLDLEYPGLLQGEFNFEYLQAGDWRILKLDGKMGGFVALEAMNGKHAEYYVRDAPIARYFSPERWPAELDSISPLGIQRWLQRAEQWNQSGSWQRMANTTTDRLSLSYQTDPTRVREGSDDQVILFQFLDTGEARMDFQILHPGGGDWSPHSLSINRQDAHYLIPKDFEAEGMSAVGNVTLRSKGTVTEFSFGVPDSVTSMADELARMRSGFERADYGPTIPHQPYDREALASMTEPASSIRSILEKPVVPTAATTLTPGKSWSRRALFAVGIILVIAGVVGGMRSKKS